jgi:EmrB/QacA subfamily drug resistance transporter
VLGSSVAFLDATFVSVALPVMQRELDAPSDVVQWIVEAYALFLASLVLIGGALGDRLGRKRVFMAGTVLFALASAACGAAPNAPWLVTARAVQGVGAAMLVPGSLALVTAAYPDDRARGTAIGTWSAGTAIVSACGPVLGGWVVQHVSWRWLFFVNVPIAALVVALTQSRVAESCGEHTSKRLDFRGALLVTLGLGLVVYALVDTGVKRGTVQPVDVTLLVAGAVLLVAFALLEARVTAPMVPLHLFHSPVFTGTNLLTLLLYAALGAALFFLPFDLIQVQGYTPAAAGAALLPFIVLMSLMSHPMGKLAGRIGARIPLIVGPLLSAAGFALLARPGIGGAYLSTFFPGIVVLGVGMGATVAPLTSAVMGAVDRDYAGTASGINNAVARAAGLLAVAALGLVLSARFDHSLDERLTALSPPESVWSALEPERPRLAAADPPDIGDPTLERDLRTAIHEAYVTGFRTVMATCALLATLGAATAAVLLRGKQART